jgi:DNA repair protein RadC
MESLCDAEVLSIAMGSAMSRAAELIERAGGLVGLAMHPIADASRPTLRVLASLELARRLHRSIETQNIRMPHSRAVARWAQPLTVLEHEELWLLALDARNRMRSSRRVAMGGLSGLHVAVRDPLRLALRDAASAFVLVHNHPSGDPTPSAEDISFTRRLADAAAVMGTPLLDHVVIGRDGFVSMLDAGLLHSVPSKSVPLQKSASCESLGPARSEGG